MLSAKNYTVSYFELLLRNSEVIFQHRISWKFLFADNVFCTGNIWAFRLIQVDTFYRPPMKLREGNVLTRVPLSVHREGVPLWPLFMIHGTSLYKDSLPSPSPAPSTSDMGPPWPQPPGSDIFWSPLETYSNLFTWGHPSLVLTSGATEAHTVGWQVDGMHLTGMLSCLQHFYKIRKNRMCKKKDLEE